jgi:Fe-S-cluster containining protein
VADGTVTVNSEITIGGDSVEIEMELPAHAVPLRRMLPVISMATDQFVEIGVAASRNQGESVSCRKGCSACCRQLVPISETEAFEIADIVGQMPEPKRAEVTARFAIAVRRISDAGLLADLDRYGSMSVQQRQELHRRYFQLGIECPLLEGDACSIHERRPLVCREFLVTSDAANCNDPFANPINPVKLLFSSADVLRDLSRADMFIPLTVSLQLVSSYPSDKRQKTGPEWMEEFLEKLHSRISAGKELDDQ